MTLVNSHPPSVRTAADFDARAATWDEDPSQLERAQAVVEAIAREVALSWSMRALEYGAGSGLLSFLLRGKLGEITLADVSDGMLDGKEASGRIRTLPIFLMVAVKS